MPIGKAETWKDRGGVTRTRPRRPGPRRQGAYTPPHSGFRLQTCDLFGRLGVRSGAATTGRDEDELALVQAGARTKPPAGRAPGRFGSPNPAHPPIRAHVRRDLSAAGRRWCSGGAGTEPNTNQPKPHPRRRKPLRPPPGPGPGTPPRRGRANIVVGEH